MHSVRKKSVRLLAVGVVLVAALTLVSRSTQPPVQPFDAAHRDLAGNPDCAPCHAADAAVPLGRRHPPKDDCLHCHPPAG